VILIDGARGEGGGQVARLALALGAATGRAVRVTNVRANREQPGLKAGHAAAFRALAQLCDGTVEGAQVGSTDVTLRPGAVVGGDYAFAIETAGPVTLLAQALLPAIVASRQAFTLRLRGGTNVAWAPQWDDYAHVHLPLLRRLGIHAEGALQKRGYFPQGGGEATLEVSTPSLAPADFTQQGELRSLHAVVSSHGLPRHVIERALVAIPDALRDVRAVEVSQDFHRGPGVGMAIALRAECARTVLGADAVGRKGVRVEDVVLEATSALRAEIASGAGLDVHQADQMPVFLALAGGGSFTCRRLSEHARTVLDMLPEFLPVKVQVDARGALTHVRLS